MKKIMVVMSTYNGEKYLQEQIDSILSQKHVYVTLKIRDDGSTDSTPEIIKQNAFLHSNLIYELGENIGFRQSFYKALLSCKDVYDYYAFADQDDVWKCEKLYKAICALESKNNELKLYASGLKVVDQDLNYMYENSFKGIKISLGSALSRQRLAGCTMVFNKRVYELCKKFEMPKDDLISHDGAVYYIVLLCGGEIVFQPKGEILFRRHEGTVTEHGKGFVKRIISVINIFGSNKNLKYRQLELLSTTYTEYIPKENKILVDEILSYKKNLMAAWTLFKERNIECGIWQVDLVNKIAILLNCY